MTPWSCFWFPCLDEESAVSRDAALWSPHALTEAQQAMWQMAAQATDNWWRYWGDVWAQMPVQPLQAMPTLCPPAPKRRTRSSSRAQ